MKYGVIPTNLVERLALATGKVPLPVLDVLVTILKSRAIMAGVSLGLFEAMREHDHVPSALAARLGLDAECLELLLRALVVFDYVVQRDGAYALSSLGRETMIAGGSRELFGYVEWNYTQWDLVAQLEGVVRTGRGVDFHETLNDVGAWARYQRAMLEITRLDAPLVASRVKVPNSAETLLDLGGSHGLIGAAICRAHPRMRATVIDLPQAIAHARRLAAAEGITDIVEYRAGDVMTADLGRGVDLAVLSNILHHFSPERGRMLLARVHAALDESGTVAIWEMEATRSPAKSTAGDVIALYFRLTSTARLYHASEYARWLEDAGFTGIRIVRPRSRPLNVLVTARR
jgi:O-methyltransferase domain